MMMHKLSLLIQVATCVQLVWTADRFVESWPGELGVSVEADVSGLAAAAAAAAADSHRRLDQSAKTSNGSRQVRSVCLWDCWLARQRQQQQQQQLHQKQNTTRLLLFTRPNGEETGANGADDQLAAASFTKFSSPNELRESGFQPQHHTILMIHGFRGSGISRQPWALETKELALNQAGPRANVLFADWSHHARVLSYLHAMEHIGEVAEDLFSMLERFESVLAGFRMERMEIIGHSLGAHIAGLLGQMMRGRLHKITALDPTGFLLNSARSHLKLSRDDAKYVIAYHTDTRYFGTNMNLADRDVYFGDGSNQPGCGREHFAAQFLPSTCNHRLSTRYSSTFMGHCLMVGYLCASYPEFSSGACGFCERDSPDCVLVGHKWQYYESQLVEKLAGLESIGIRKSQELGGGGGTDGVEWNENHGSRYFIEVQANKPYCAFTYQVVAVFPENIQLAQLKHLELVLVSTGAANKSFLEPETLTQEVLRVRLTNQRHLNRVKVFTDSWGQTGFVEGEHVFTGLALLQSATNNSTRIRLASPLKFNEALIVEHPGGRNKAASLDSQSQLEEASKVFVNYMSHIGFEQRAAMSGPLQVKWISGLRIARE